MNTTSFNGKLRSFASRHALFGTTYSNDFIATPIFGSPTMSIYTSPYGSSDVSFMSSVNTIFDRSPSDMVVDNQGDFYLATGIILTGTSVVYKINKVGSIVASQSSTHPDPTLYSDGEHVYFVDKNTSPYSFSKYDKNLNKIWSHTQSTPYYATRGITSDLNDNVFVSYGFGTSSKVNKLSATGSLLWSATASLSIISLATDKDGFLYIGQSGNALVKKLDANGTTVFDKSIVYGTFSSYSVAYMSISNTTNTIYTSVYDYKDYPGPYSASSSVPVIAYDLDFNVKANLGVYAANAVAWSPYINVGESGYVYLVKPLSLTASVIEKWSDVTYTKIATSQVIYYTSPGFPAGPIVLVNPKK
jgi:hypothetical protein